MFWKDKYFDPLQFDPFLKWVILVQFQSAQKDSHSKLNQTEPYEQIEVDQSFKFLFTLISYHFALFIYSDFQNFSIFLL